MHLLQEFVASAAQLGERWSVIRNCQWKARRGATQELMGRGGPVKKDGNLFQAGSVDKPLSRRRSSVFVKL